MPKISRSLLVINHESYILKTLEDAYPDKPQVIEELLLAYVQNQGSEETDPSTPLKDLIEKAAVISMTKLRSFGDFLYLMQHAADETATDLKKPESGWFRVIEQKWTNDSRDRESSAIWIGPLEGLREMFPYRKFSDPLDDMDEENSHRRRWLEQLNGKNWVKVPKDSRKIDSRK